MLALISGALMWEKGGENWEKFKSKKCVCIKHSPGSCVKLRCCEVFKLLPYKVYTKRCRYGKCRFEKGKKEGKDW